MQDIPIMLDGFELMVSEPPAVKMVTKDDGTTVPSVTRDGVTQFVVALFVKPKPVEGERLGRGEEIRVTLASDPGDGFPARSDVELIAPTVKYWEVDGRSGLTFKALGLKPLTARRAPKPPPSAAGPAAA